MNCILTVGYVKKKSQECYAKAVMSNVRNISYDFNQNKLIVDMGKGLMIKLYKLEPYPLLIEQFNVLYSNVFKYEMFEYYFILILQKSSNQNTAFIRQDNLIGCFPSTNTKLLLESFMTTRPDMLIQILTIIELILSDKNIRNYMFSF